MANARLQFTKKFPGVEPGSCDPLVRTIAFAKGCFMIAAIVMILIVLWLLGMVTSYTMGGVIHILLVVAVVVVLLRVVQGRRAI